MAYQRKYPVVFGVNGQASKCLIAPKGEHKLYIFWLKDGNDLKIGDSDFSLDVVGGQIEELWFCRKESLKAMIDILRTMYDTWADGEEMTWEQNTDT